jgi:hypothetical protein
MFPVHLLVVMQAAALRLQPGSQRAEVMLTQQLYASTCRTYALLQSLQR